MPEVEPGIGYFLFLSVVSLTAAIVAHSKTDQALIACAVFLLIQGTFFFKRQGYFRLLRDAKEAIKNSSTKALLFDDCYQGAPVWRLERSSRTENMQPSILWVNYRSRSGILIETESTSYIGCDCFDKLSGKNLFKSVPVAVYQMDDHYCVIQGKYSYHVCEIAGRNH
jgi:hypothetical protein